MNCGTQSRLRVLIPLVTNSGGDPSKQGIDCGAAQSTLVGTEGWA